jgi:diguanylate cyclase (GGDEF)-like protein
LEGIGAMDQKVTVHATADRNIIRLQIAGKSATAVHETMHSMERREWWLWSYTFMVTILLMVGIASFAFPALLNDVDGAYSFFLDHAVRGLVGLVLVFNVYVVYQQLQINRIRHQVTDQVFAVDKVEVMAQEIYKMAILDPLTGLFNRRYIEQRLEDEIARSHRHGDALTVILFDLDGLKQTNDKFGHTAGDALLKAFAERLKKATRGSDVSARYGGDEFMVLLTECRPENVAHVLNRLDASFVTVGEERIPVCYSAGWSDYVAGESVSELLARADAALYARKRAAKVQRETASAPA